MCNKGHQVTWGQLLVLFNESIYKHTSHISRPMPLCSLPEGLEITFIAKAGKQTLERGF